MKNHRPYRVVWVFLCANFFTQAALGGLRGLFHDPEQGARHDEKPPPLSGRLGFFYAQYFSLKLRLAQVLGIKKPR
jgi:hypothetical protein